MTPSYTSISRRSLDVEDYIDIVRRHASWILGPLFAGVVIACVAAFIVPNTYVSSAIMRITPAQISQDLVRSTVTQQMNERIAQMQQQITSRTNLLQLIQNPTLKLYSREVASGSLEDAAERMRNDIHISLISLAGQGNRPASAFSISFSYDNRFKAQAVVQSLITSFVDSMDKLERDQGKVTTQFLANEIARAKADVDRLDTELTQFRVKNAGHLPEELQVNMQALNGLQQQYSAINAALQRNAEEKTTLETNLNTLRTSRDNVSSMATSTQESATTKVQNERLTQLNHEITEMEAYLLQLETRYTDKHPSIRDAKTQLELKKKERDQLQAKDDVEAAKPKQAAKIITNPAALERLTDIQGGIDMVQTQLRNKATEQLKLMKDIDDLNKLIAVYQSRIAMVPANQQKFVALSREHELSQTHYLDLQRAGTAAATSDDVGKAKAGETLEVLDAASLPEAPTAPNRWLYVGIGAGLGLAAGIALAGIKEVKDTSLKNLKDVRAYTNLPVLSSIPLLENDILVRRKRRLAYVGWAAAFVLGVVAMSGSMYYHFYYLTS